MRYTKDPRTPEQHIELLKERGLSFKDESRAVRCLKNIGYYRLTGYMYHQQSRDGEHNFFEGTEFNDIILHYQFDKKLRGIVSEYLERIEVALRSRLTDCYSLSHGFFWYDQKELYQNLAVYDNIALEIRENFQDPQELFLKAFKSKYVEESIPPSNMAMETLSFGKLARLYGGLKNDEEKQKIAEDFNLPSTVLTSWLIYLANVRNVCAHHSRLWNKRVTADRPTIPSRRKYKFNGSLPQNFNTTSYGVFSLIHRLLQAFNPDNSFIEKIEILIEEYPVIETGKMGFPEDWKTNSTWKAD